DDEYLLEGRSDRLAVRVAQRWVVVLADDPVCHRVAPSPSCVVIAIIGPPPPSGRERLALGLGRGALRDLAGGLGYRPGAGLGAARAQLQACQRRTGEREAGAHGEGEVEAVSQGVRRPGGRVRAGLRI